MATNNQAGTYGEVFGESFQWHILAVAARYQGFIIRYRTALDHTYFVNGAARIIAKCLLAFVDAYKTLPTRVTLTEAVRAESDDEKSAKAVLPWIDKLYEADISDAVAICEKTVEFGRQQAMCNAVLQSAALVDKGKRSEVLSVIQGASLVGTDLTDLGISYTDANRMALYGPDATYLRRVPTGIPHLDKALGGGLKRSGLTCLLGVPKKGKTTSMVNIGFGALLALEGYNVVHYSCEMEKADVVRRYDDRLSGPVFDLKLKNPEEYATQIAKKAKLFIKGRLYVQSYPTRTMTTSMLRSHLSLLASHDFIPDLIIVDYADIMRAERRVGEMRHEQAGIYEDLRGLGGEYDAAVLTASQAKQSAVEKQTLTISDFAEAFEKAAIMDCGIALCQTNDEASRERMRMVIVANRDGPDLTTVEAKMNRNRCLLKSVALYDPLMARIPVEGDEDSDLPEQLKTEGKVKTANKSGPKIDKKVPPVVVVKAKPATAPAPEMKPIVTKPKLPAPAKVATKPIKTAVKTATKG